MLKNSRSSNSIYLSLLSALLFVGCGQKNNTPQAFTPTAPPVVFEEDAKPTLSIPENSNPDTAYVPPDTTIINTRKNTPIFLGRLRLTGARIYYSSIEKRINVTGLASLLNDKNEKISEKNFSLVGEHEANQLSFKLIDEKPDTQTDETKKLVIRAQANCLQTAVDDSADCSHVVVDIFVKNNGQVYTEQVEVNRSTSGRSQPPAVQPPAVQPPAASASQDNAPPAALDEDDAQKEDQDQSDTSLQSEGTDDSIDGRYDGTAQNIDLDDLFSEPAGSTSGDSSAAPPASGDDSTRMTPAPQASSDATRRSTPTPPASPDSSTRRDDVTPPRTPITGDRQLNPDLVQTRNGEVRPVNQAIGYPNAGRLRNATSLVTKQQALANRAFFEVVAPGRQRHYATYEMAVMIERSGSLLNTRYTKKLYVSSASAKNGGLLNPHKSHQMGTDVDLGYPSDTVGMKFPLVVKKSTRAYYPNNYSVEKTYNVFKFMFSQPDIKVDRIFVDDKIKAALCTYAKSHNELTGNDKDLVKKMFENLQHVTGHGDHFHLRLKCSASDPGCRSRVYRKMPSCS